MRVVRPEGSAGGRLLAAPAEWNATLLMSLFRERLLARLVLAHAISPQLRRRSGSHPDDGRVRWGRIGLVLR